MAGPWVWESKPKSNRPPSSIRECYHHGGVWTNKFCVRCQRSFCDNCLVKIKGRFYCNVCSSNPIIDERPDNRYRRNVSRYGRRRYRWESLPAEKPLPRIFAKHPGVGSIILGTFMMILGFLVCFSNLTEGEGLSPIGCASLLFGYLIFRLGRDERKNARR